MLFIVLGVCTCICECKISKCLKLVYSFLWGGGGVSQSVISFFLFLGDGGVVCLPLLLEEWP